MCGIAGLKEKNRLKDTIDLLAQRGNKAYSCLSIHENGFYVTKAPLSKKKAFFNDIDILPAADYYLIHTQSSTNSEQRWSQKYSHPYKIDVEYEGKVMSFFMAHNGVIQNWQAMADALDIKDIKTDTEFICKLFARTFKYHCKSKPLNISEIFTNTCLLLHGTFALWLFDAMNSQIYVTNTGCSLFMDPFTNEFSSVASSIPTPCIPVQEGVIYQITHEGMTTVSSYGNSSPFFIL